MTSTGRILVTGSSDGLGLATARRLIDDGYEVILHARNPARAKQAMRAAPGAASVVVADFTSFSDVRNMAATLNSGAPLTALIHNAGVGYREPSRITTVDGHSHVLQVNVLSPYLLTTLIEMPPRMVWLTSGLHRDGETALNDIDWKTRHWNGFQAYADSKLFDAALSAAYARLHPATASNSVEPGWVPTKMGGIGAPDDLTQAHLTQVWLVEETDPAAHGTGRHFYHQALAVTHPAVTDTRFQDELLGVCARLTTR